MNKLVTGFVVAFFLLSLISAIFDGGGIGTTVMTAPVDEIENVISVASTSGFLTSGVLVIQGEKIAYAGTNAVQFTGCTRGVETTTVTTHAAGTYVYSEDTGVMNMALGFNPAAIATSNGYFAAVVIPWKFFTTTMPKLMLWNFSFFTGDLIVVRYVLMIMSIGFYIAFVIQIGTVIANALGR